MQGCSGAIGVQLCIAPQRSLIWRIKHNARQIIWLYIGVYATTTRGCHAASAAAIRAAIPDTVAEEDRAKFFALIEEEFKTLHEGNAIRFGLGPLEFVAWRREIGKVDV